MSKVLIVDDEKSIRITLSEFLKKDGFEADMAEDAKVALEMLEHKEYDVVVTDIIMPKISGLDLLTSIRAKSEDTQVIIMTGEPTVDTAVKAVKSGANDYLIKPINKENFLKAVHYAAKLKILNDEKTLLEIQNLNYQKNLEEMVITRTQSLQEAMESIISLLSSVVETRDPYTAGHQRRVGNLSAAIAEKMRLSESTVTYIRIIGYIHDIGKIYIPTEILSKPGKISKLEMELIRTHSMKGFEMINTVKLPDFIANTICQHHERCDGSGYPLGLTMDKIGVEAQIIMVADVVEAMVSHRPYRPALGVEAALNEVDAHAGTLYNKEVVNACLKLFKEDDYILDDHEHKIYFPL